MKKLILLALVCFQSDTCNSKALSFEKLPEIDTTRSPWTDTNTKSAIKLISQNLNTLESYISFVVSNSLLLDLSFHKSYLCPHFDITFICLSFIRAVIF